MPAAKPDRAVDCHAHVFSADAPAIANARYRPAYAATLDGWREQWTRGGITHGVLVQISFFGTDNSEMLAAIAQDPRHLRGVAVIDAAVGDGEIDRLHAAGVRGVRLNLQGAVDFAEYGTAPWLATYERIARRGWHVEVNTDAGRAPQLAHVLSRAPVDLVVDHFANPGDDADATFDALARVSRDRAVWVKLSGAYRLGGGDARALAQRWIATLGADRLVWGSDWPWTRHEGGRDYARLRSDLDQWVGADTARAVLWDNAARLYRFE